MRLGSCPITVLQYNNLLDRCVASVSVFCQIVVMAWNIIDELVGVCWKVSNNFEYFVCNMSDTNGSFKFECRVSFLIYHGATVIIRNILFCMTCIFCVLEAEPQIEQPFVQRDLIMEAYNCILMYSGLCKRSK